MMQIQCTKNVNPGRFELGTTLSWSIWSDCCKLVEKQEQGSTQRRSMEGVALLSAFLGIHPCLICDSDDDQQSKVFMVYL